MREDVNVDPQQWDERYSGDDLLWGAGPNAQVVAQLADLAPGTAVDVAGGEGRNAIWLAEQGWDATVVDFSAVALGRARQLAADRGVAVATVEADVTAWSPAAPVDLVLLAYVQLAGDQRRALLRAAAGWVAAGGTLMVIAHDRQNVAHGHGGPPSEEVCYDLDETVAALEGLEVTTAEVVDRHVETAEGTAVALDTLVVARAPA